MVWGGMDQTLDWWAWPGAVLKIFGEAPAGPSSFGRQQQLSEITIKPITSNMWKS